MTDNKLTVTVKTFHQNPRHNQDFFFDNVKEGIEKLMTYAGEEKPTGVSTLEIKGGSYRGYTYAQWRWNYKRRSQIEWSK